MEKLRKLFKVSRPISWVNTAYPFAATYLVLGAGVDLTFVLGTLFFLIPYNLLMYGINDVFDYESDIRNPRKNSIEGAVEAKSFHPVILNAAISLSLPFIVALVFLGQWTADVTLFAVLFFVVAYSVKGLRFKEKPFLDSITSSLHFVGPMIYAFSLLGFTTSTLPIVIAFFLWGIASHAFGAVQDIIPDRQGKLASIATVIGARATVWMSLILYVVAALLIMSVGGTAVFVGIAGLAYAVNVIPYLKLTDDTSEKAHAGWRRFIWINYPVGAIVTVVIILSTVYTT